MFDESHADTEALLALGQRARAAQDAWFVATTPSDRRAAHGADPDVGPGRAPVAD